MSGYTPVFGSVFTGSLCGQYPDTAAWLFLLALADRYGEIDMTPQYISSVTGMPISDLLACIDRFLQPDPASRTAANEGRRLERLDSARPWGWRILNFGAYRERARLTAKNAREVESRRNAERLRTKRETAADRRSPPPTASHTQTQTHTQTQIEIPNSEDPWSQFKAAYPRRSGDQKWKAAQKAIAARLAEGHTWAEIFDGTRRYAAYCHATDKVGSEYVKAAATFVGPEKPFLEPWAPPSSRTQRRQDANLSATDQWLRQQEATNASD